MVSICLHISNFLAAGRLHQEEMVGAAAIGAYAALVLGLQCFRKKRDPGRNGNHGGSVCYSADSLVVEEPGCQCHGSRRQHLLFPAADLCGPDACLWSGGYWAFECIYGGGFGDNFYSGEGDGDLFFSALYGSLLYPVPDVGKQDGSDTAGNHVIGASLDGCMAVCGNK